MENNKLQKPIWKMNIKNDIPHSEAYYVNVVTNLNMVGIGVSWPGDKGQPRKFQKDIKQGDWIIVNIPYPSKKQYLVEVLSDCFDNQNSNAWFELARYIKVIDEIGSLGIKPAYGSLERCHQQGILNTLNKKYASHIPSMQINNKIEILKKNHNLILTGAPGTGKTYTAKQVAVEMCEGDLSKEVDEEWRRLLKDGYVGFVQFHPSYDYTDFVEGLRPIKGNIEGEIGFERKDGIFKEFCKRAIKNLEDSHKSIEELNRENNYAELLEDLLTDSIENAKKYHTKNNSTFVITDANDKNIYISILTNEKVKDLPLNKEYLLRLLNSGQTFDKVKDVTIFFNTKNGQIQDSYYFILLKEILKLKQKGNVNKQITTVSKKDFIFIIDEINRGELSKIFGELFFSIDPGYRGKQGKIYTQYQNLVDDELFAEGFYIPENVYIIGTMNDIDRGVESMDFAIRRRFAWKEVTAEESAIIIDKAEVNDDIKTKAKKRMTNLNNAIREIDGLGEAFCLGGAYFKKIENYNEDFGKLWENHIEGLLKEYLRGMPDATQLLAQFKEAYDKV